MKNKEKEYLFFWVSLLVITMLLFISNLQAQTPTKKELFEELKRQNIINPVAAFQISMLETGHLKSNIAKKQNNLFGLQNSCGYLEFTDWRECVKYFAKLECKWYDKFIKVNTGTYYDFVAWWGYKTGKSCSKKDIVYAEFLKKIKVCQ